MIKREGKRRCLALKSIRIKNGEETKNGVSTPCDWDCIALSGNLIHNHLFLFRERGSKGRGRIWRLYRADPVRLLLLAGNVLDMARDNACAAADLVYFL